MDCNRCPHEKHKYKCAACKAARAGQPAPPEVKPEPDIKPDPEVKSEPKVKPDPEVKLEPDIKQEPEPFTIRGYFGIGDQRDTDC